MALQKIFFSPAIAGWLSWVPGKNTGSDKHRSVWYGIIIALVVLVFTLPALASANPLFEQWLAFIIPNITLQLDVWIARTVVFAVLIWFIPKLLSASKSRLSEPSKKESHRIAWWIPQLMMVLIMGIFLVSQLQLYTMSSSELLEAGITHSQRTKRGVWTIDMGVTRCVSFALGTTQTR
jgi:MFS family permease